MAVVQRGEADFTVDGVRWRLVVDFAAFAEAEDMSGLGVHELMEAIRPERDAAGKVIRAPKLKHLGALLYGALREHHPETTPRDAINLLGSGSIVGEALGKALTGAMPKTEPGDEGESAEGNGTAAPGTGTKPKRTGQRKG